MFEFLAQYSLVIMEVFIGCITFFLLGATGLLGNGIRNVFGGLAHRFWGNVSNDELKKFGYLALAFFMVIGSYWMLRTIKDGFFDTMVGFEYQPYAKLLTLGTFFFVILLYGKISDMFEKSKLFWIFCTFFAGLFCLIGLAYTFIDTTGSVGLLGQGLGWFTYVSIECFGSIIPAALFWAFVSSITSTESAKRGYPIIFLAAQAGNFLGATVVAEKATALGFSNLFYVTAAVIMLIPFIVQRMLDTTPAELLTSDKGADVKKKRTGVFEGLRLIGSHNYLMGVAVVATVYEVIATVVDFQFKMMAKQIYTKEAFSAYIARFAQVNAFVAIMFALIGTSYVLRTFGVRFCLLGYPTIVAVAVLSVFMKPELSVFFFAMVLIKAFSYVLNNPVKELLYIPTSKDVKFKAKGFIDAFGGRTSKATGSAINATMAGSFNAICLISAGVIGVWLLAALGLGVAYNKLRARNEIIS